MAFGDGLRKGFVAAAGIAADLRTCSVAATAFRAVGLQNFMPEKTSDNFFHRFRDLIPRKRTGGDADTLHIAQRPRDYAVRLPPLPMQCADSPQRVQRSWKISPWLDDPFWNQEDPKRSLCSLSSADTHTPSDLRAIPFIVSPVEMTPLTPVPPPPRAACPSQLRFKDTKVIRGIRVLTAKDKFGPILEKLQHFQDGIVTSPGHTVPTKTFTAVKPLTPKPPTVPIPQKRGPRPGTLLRRAKVVPIDDKKADSQCSQNNPRESRVKLPHLHQLADKLGAAVTLKTGTFTERFLIAASRMAGDAAPEARYHGRTIIEKLTLHKDFMNLWMKIVPEKDRRPVEKTLKKTGVLWRRA
ncbi:uncharacterized protein LOC121812002 [Haplochromis burtoni]|uniref:uncharacterized protein LOC121812002 n=1 Tax=Haplochromis burtoni TaxID=8153 RepID=UPI001C2D77B1|nr:uncharacterized protein LOC121812002 [Haplochromis burtoni]